MITSRGMKFRDEDDAHDHARQREIDEANETQRALFDGKEAGRQGACKTSNPFPTGTAQHASWESGRAQTAKEAA